MLGQSHCLTSSIFFIVVLIAINVKLRKNQYFGTDVSLYKLMNSLPGDLVQRTSILISCQGHVKAPLSTTDHWGATFPATHIRVCLWVCEYKRGIVCDIGGIVTEGG